MHFTSAALLASSIVFHVSESVPSFDVAASCRAAVAASVGMAEAQSYATCMKEENDTREQLVQSWQSFSAADRQSCTAESSSAGVASYVELIVCLQLAGKSDPEKLATVRGARRK